MKTSQPLLMRMLGLSGPVALARLGIMAMGVTDVILVGQLAPHDLAVQALGWAPTGVALVGGIGLATGVQVLGARAIGERQEARAGDYFFGGLALSLVYGVGVALALIFGGGAMLTAFGVDPDLSARAGRVTAVLALSVPLQLCFTSATFFLEAISRPKAGAVVMWLANGVNLALNLLWIPELGAIGSAWATVCARAFMALSLIGFILAMRDRGAFGIDRIRIADRGVVRALLAVGFASFVSQIAEAGAFSGVTVIAARISETAAATYQIMLNLLAVVFMATMGIAAATQVLVSEAVGRRDIREAAQAGWTGLALTAVLLVIAGLVFVALGPWIARAYTAEPALVAALVALMPIAAVVLLPDGGQVVAASALRGRGDNWFPTACHIVSYVLVLPPLAFVLGERMGRGVQGLMEAIMIASLVSVGLLVARFAWLTRPGSSPLPG